MAGRSIDGNDGHFYESKIASLANQQATARSITRYLTMTPPNKQALERGLWRSL